MTEGRTYDLVAVGSIVLKWTSDSQVISEQMTDKIEIAWQQMLQSGKQLTNELLLSFQELKKHQWGTEVIGKFVEYKHFISQRINPDIDLGIKPIGVSGLIFLREGGIEYTAFARRARNVTQYPGFLELMPSGSIDKGVALEDGTVDYKSKLLDEFTEETCLSSEAVREVKEFALVEDKIDSVYDICCKIFINVSKERFLQYCSQSAEYLAVELVPTTKLKYFVGQRQQSIVPASLAIIEAFMLSGEGLKGV